MTTQNQEGISLHPVFNLVVPNETFYAIVDKVKTEKTSSKKLAEEFYKGNKNIDLSNLPDEIKNDLKLFYIKTT